MRDLATLRALRDEAGAALGAALAAGTATPPPPRGPTAARNWAITVTRLDARPPLRVLGAAHGLSVERTRQVVAVTTVRWAKAYRAGFTHRWLVAAYGPHYPPSFAREDG